MIKVSDNFKRSIKGFNREVYGFVKVFYNGCYLNQSAHNFLALSDYDAPISNYNSVFDITPKSINYASLERDYFKLDGSFILPSNPNINNNKYLTINQNNSFSFSPNISFSVDFCVAFECQVGYSDTTICNFIGTNNTNIKFSVANDNKLKITGLYNGLEVNTNATTDFLLNHKCKVIITVEALDKMISISIRTDDGCYAYAMIPNISDSFVALDTILFSQNNAKYIEINDIYFKQGLDKYGYLNDNEANKYFMYGELEMPTCYFKFSEESMINNIVIDEIANNEGIIIGPYDLRPVRHQNDCAGWIGNDLNAGTFKIRKIRNNYFLQNDTMTIYFNNGFARKFELMLYLSENSDTEYSEIETIKVEDNENTIYTFKINSKLRCLTGIDIKILEWSNPYHRPRIAKIEEGKSTIYEDDRLIEFQVQEQLSKFNEEMPDADFSMKLNNYDREFDDINENTILNEINKYTRLLPYVGIKSDFIEYVPLGVFNFSSVSNSSDLTTTINGRGNYNFLENQSSNFTSGSFKISELAQPLNIPYKAKKYDYKFDDVVTNNYADFSNYLEQFQALIFRSCSLSVPSRYIVELDEIPAREVRTIPKIVSNRFSLNEQLDYPVLEKKNKIYAINYKLKNVYGQSSESKEIYNQTLQGEEYKFSVSGTEGILRGYMYNLSLKLTTPIDYTSVKVYVDNTPVTSLNVNGIYENHIGNYFGLNITVYSDGIKNGVYDENLLKNTIDLKVTANQYESTEYTTMIVNPNIKGEDGNLLNIDNPYIRTTSDMNKISNYIFENDTSYRARLSTNGDPSTQCGDLIEFETPFGWKKMIVESHSIKFDGGLSATLEGDAE